jgi:protein-disulfide isomerase
MPAARAAMEAYAQRGDAGFWKMHDRIYATQATLEDADLNAHAQALGLDMTRFVAALSDGRHDAAIDRDKQLAGRLGIHGTPGFVINDYFLSGAQPLDQLEKLVKRALEDVRLGRKPGTP